MNDENQGPIAQTRAAIERSPNYPSIPLTPAIDLATKWYGKEKRTSVTAEVAAKALGYSSLSGAARTAIAALRQYGLVESTRDGLRLTDLAMDIIHHPIGSMERTNALQKAAVSPALFAELIETHGDASDDSLRAYLITKRKFSPDGAGRFLPAFREAVGLVRLLDAASSEANQPSNNDVQYPAPQAESLGWIRRAMAPRQPGHAGPTAPRQPPAGGAPESGDSMQFVWPLSGNVVATMTVSKQIEEDDIETLLANLKAAEIAIRKQAKLNSSKQLATTAEADNAG